MTLEEILEIADKGYHEPGFILQYYAQGSAPDKLAEAIAANLEDSLHPEFDRQEQLEHSIATMESLKKDLERVIEALEDELRGDS